MLLCLQVLVVLLVSLWALPALWYHRPRRLALRYLPLALWLLLKGIGSDIALFRALLTYVPPDVQPLARS